MALPGSGALSLNQIAGEFGGTTPHSLSEYYRGGGLVPSHGGTSGIPSSGTIAFNAFYGKSKVFVFNQTITGTTAHYNLRNQMVSAGWDQVSPVQATVTVNSGVAVYSTAGNWAWRIGGSLPAGSSVVLYNYGYIIGAGASGMPGTGVSTSNTGVTGSYVSPGHALYVEWYLTVYNYGYIGGGGGTGGAGSARYQAYAPGDGGKIPPTPGYRAGGGGGGRGGGYPVYSSGAGGVAQLSTNYTVGNGAAGNADSSYTAGATGGAGASVGVCTGGAGGSGGALGGTGTAGAAGSGGTQLVGTTGSGPGYAYYRTNSAYLSVPAWGNILGSTY